MLGFKSILHFIGEVLFWFFNEPPNCSSFSWVLCPLAGRVCCWGAPSAVHHPGHHQRQDGERARDPEPAGLHPAATALPGRGCQSGLREWLLWAALGQRGQCPWHGNGSSELFWGSGDSASDTVGSKHCPAWKISCAHLIAVILCWVHHSRLMPLAWIG